MTKKAPTKKRSPIAAIGALLAAIALALGLRCGLGLGLGEGEGEGEGKGEVKQKAEETPKAEDAPAGAPDAAARALAAEATADAAPPRCQLRIDEVEVLVDGKAAPIPAAVEACRPYGDADLTITGAARVGVINELKSALRTAGIQVFVHEKNPN